MGNAPCLNDEKIDSLDQQETVWTQRLKRIYKIQKLERVLSAEGLCKYLDDNQRLLDGMTLNQYMTAMITKAASIGWYELLLGILDNYQTIVKGDGLVLAATNGHVKCVHILLAAGYDPSVDENICLRRAAKKNYTSIIKCLAIIDKVDINVKESYVLKKAVKFANIEVVDFLARNCQIDYRVGLEEAIKNDNNEIATMLLPFTSADEDRIPSLFIAIEHRNSFMCRAIIQRCSVVSIDVVLCLIQHYDSTIVSDVLKISSKEMIELHYLLILETAMKYQNNEFIKEFFQVTSHYEMDRSSILKSTIEKKQFGITRMLRNEEAFKHQLPMKS
ncbi:Hypothetical protein POVR1_LOCUS251 [uncultured virus]|nr:Hypothetical protein POVR1_LOCUS251 [uncultured virus]